MNPSRLDVDYKTSLVFRAPGISDAASGQSTKHRNREAGKEEKEEA
jgi:hypothetical protein